MRGMSIKAKLGWVLAAAVGFLLVMAVMAAQPTFGAHPGPRLHYYMVAFACTENKLECIQLPPGEFVSYGRCWEHLMDVRIMKQYAIPGHPLVLGKCMTLPKPGVET